ncbi:EamA family transporter [Flavobacterium sp. SUN052]|uniref:EamA family transporter n=1 Tax=Flavobacterium sp. SUN052 TaxID=3002441 RepID=UPI00237DAE37|nr:EamA family transporter [Flavobacterium sp. SUN052]MEC4005332.1 EamA family transporter [Flavobacterium sp. SUN052]
MKIIKRFKMETWILYALISMVFAGLTSVLAKYGLQNINSDLGLGIRTTTIFVLLFIFILSTNKLQDLPLITNKQFLLLILSGITTTSSWVFYYHAMKTGLVSYVAAIDKASIVITLVLSFILLKEPMTPKIIAGGLLIFCGMLVLIWK